MFSKREMKDATDGSEMVGVACLWATLGWITLGKIVPEWTQDSKFWMGFVVGGFYWLAWRVVREAWRTSTPAKREALRRAQEAELAARRKREDEVAELRARRWGAPQEDIDE